MRRLLPFALAAALLFTDGPDPIRPGPGAVAAATKRCRDARGRFTKCPPPVPAPAPVPPAPITAWMPAPLTVGGYACNKAQVNTPHIGACGTSIVYRITGSMMSGDAVPVPMFTAVFFQDASGSFPTSDAYAVNSVGYWAATDLIGIAPAP